MVIEWRFNEDGLITVIKEDGTSSSPTGVSHARKDLKGWHELRISGVITPNNILTLTRYLREEPVAVNALYIHSLVMKQEHFLEICAALDHHLMARSNDKIKRVEISESTFPSGSVDDYQRGDYINTHRNTQGKGVKFPNCETVINEKNSFYNLENSSTNEALKKTLNASDMKISPEHPRIQYCKAVALLGGNGKTTKKEIYDAVKAEIERLRQSYSPGSSTKRLALEATLHNFIKAPNEKNGQVLYNALNQRLILAETSVFEATAVTNVRGRLTNPNKR